MQMRIESARSIMPENRADDIPRLPIRATASTPNTGRSELFQLSHGRPNRTIVRSRDTIVLPDQRQDGNILRRGNREVIKDATIGCFVLVPFFIQRPSGCLFALGQEFACLRMKIVAKSQEFIPLHMAVKSELDAPLPIHSPEMRSHSL